MKKFILRIMACLMMAVMIGTCFGSVGTVLADDTEVAYNGTVTFSDKTWWTEKQVTPEEVLGSVAPEDVVNIVFTSDTAFALGFNTNAEGNWLQLNEKTEYDVNNMWFGEGNCIKFALSKGDGVDYTITWKVYVKAAAPVETPAEEPKAEEPKAEEPKAEEPKTEEPKTEAPATADLVISFATLTAGGYGYNATVNGDAVDVSIASQYQEIQYVLPEVVDLAAYTTLIVDVTSNAQLDIKLVDPNAELNQYSQKAPFHDGYTAEGQAITSPIYIDLAAFADKDLSQINFMAMGNDTTFTIKSITFTNAAKDTEPTEEPAPAPVETPATSDNTTTGREVKEGETVYTVQKGDCLWTIAKTFLGSGKRYTELFERNSDILTDATLIKKGQEIIIPAK